MTEFSHAVRQHAIDTTRCTVALRTRANTPRAANLYAQQMESQDAAPE